MTPESSMVCVHTMESKIIYKIYILIEKWEKAMLSGNISKVPSEAGPTLDYLF